MQENGLYVPETFGDLPYGIPYIDACSAKRSFRTHCQKQKQTDAPPTAEERTRAVQAALRTYSAWRCDLTSAADPHKWFDREFNKALEEIDMDSTPGYCILTLLGSTNAQIFGWNGICCDPDRVSMVREHVKLRFNELLAGKAVSDCIKVFVKQEPHKMKKIQEGTYRLISAVSLIDTFIDRILFAWIARAQMDSVGETPCLIGWSPVRGGWRKIVNRFGNQAVNCLDRSAWDWTVQGYLVDLWILFLENLPVNPPDWWLKMMKLRFKLLFEEVWFQFEDGTRVKQATRGVMKSGCYLTILLNSLSQSLLHYVVNSRCGKPMTMKQPYSIGDDTVQEAMDWLLDYVRHLEILGITVKGAKVQHWVEFAGFCFDGKTCYPAYWQKHLFNLKYTQNLGETLRSYQYLYVNEPVMYEFVCRVARELGPRFVLPKIEALDIMNQPN
uniref:RNA-dependent RNA polymerase n=1 Tax=Guadeloupe mosquito virus TaxID=2607735 RepID=A0A894KQA5_9VIRU|nr:MAG: RNA-dependent RNA polymerase [Guadeloupe mosquito virus]QRW42398.1 MAG: RNA-dependent RNA polymerase [Guadeloupe mosquito virus]QRW42400.1 MAG: RNA-dependent RNA polymerase [Guadeloupe mosquito virus]QRW42404.1 MAG: RNA-dependent RNA polymerase [Guadeloupe mosquito virus]QRW42406.1 MAG: RNA-dependent RNA polymerase [Guadeloupe mosquito virus]